MRRGCWSIFVRSLNSSASRDTKSSFPCLASSTKPWSELLVKIPSLTCLSLFYFSYIPCLTLVLNSYLNAYDMIRDITGIGEGKGAFISIHDGFQSLSIWENFLPGSDRINLDTHPYFAFGGVAIDPSVAPKQACQSWGSSMNQR